MSDDDPVPEADEILRSLGFDEDDHVLTRRQAEVIALRERGLSQAAIADRLGTSRANVSGVETSARENVDRARETVAFADALASPVRIEVVPGTDVYDLPDRVYDACDEAGVKVEYSAPELLKLIHDEAGDAVGGRAVQRPLFIGVTADGEVGVRRRRTTD